VGLELAWRAFPNGAPQIGEDGDSTISLDPVLNHPPSELLFPHVQSLCFVLSLCTFEKSDLTCSAVPLRLQTTTVSSRSCLLPGWANAGLPTSPMCQAQQPRNHLRRPFAGCGLVCWDLLCPGRPKTTRSVANV